MKRASLGLVLVLAAASLALGTTWTAVEITCPVCGTVNVFQAPSSFGTYVYYTATRFQYVFWPADTVRFLYSCKQCHLTTYMQDFEEIPEAAVPALEAMLEQEVDIPEPVVPYYEIPVPVRLRTARRVYEELGRDSAFWSEFHRIEGYHLAEAGEPRAAHEARAKALELAEEMAPADEPLAQKERLFIIASMRFFTGDIQGAASALEQAEAVALSEEGTGGSELAGYLEKLVTDFRSEFLTQ